MSNLLVVALVGAVFAGVGWLLVTAHRQRAAEHEARALLALKQGWDYRGERSHWRPLSFSFAGRHDGIDWRLEYVTETRGKKSTRSARWVAERLRTPRLAWLLLGRSRVRFEGGLAAQFLSGLLSLRLPGESAGPDDRQAFIGGAREEPLPAVAATGFALLARPGAAVPRIDDDLAQRLVGWPLARRAGAQGSQLRLSTGAGGLRLDRRTPGGFAAEDQVELRQDSQGLQIVVHEMPADAATCAHLIALGRSLLDAQQAALAATRAG